MRKTWKTLGRRWRAKVPRFWQTVQKRGAAAIVTLTPLLAMEFGPRTKEVIGGLILFITGLVAAAQFTCDDPAETPAPSATPQ